MHCRMIVTLPLICAGCGKQDLWAQSLKLMGKKWHFRGEQVVKNWREWVEPLKGQMGLCSLLPKVSTSMNLK